DQGLRPYCARPPGHLLCADQAPAGLRLLHVVAEIRCLAHTARHPRGWFLHKSDPISIFNMNAYTSREVRLVSRPKGIPTRSNFTLAETTVESPSDQQVLVRNLFMSVDPYMRGRMNEGKSYVPSFEIGRPLEGGAVGEVVESRAVEFQAGDIVSSNFGWREMFIASPRDLHAVDRTVEPRSVFLGALGMTGMTAWAGLNMVEVKADDVVYISGAAGAVGSVAGQLAKLRGCRVIGSAGSMEKIKFLREECGFDIVFNYKEGSVSEQLQRAAPDGI